MIRFAAVRPLAQVYLTASGTFSDVVVGGGRDEPDIEITRIIISNTDASSTTVQLCHDFAAGGSPSYTKANALYWDVPVPANSVIEIQSQHPGGGIAVGRNGAIGISAADADRIVCTAYGVSAADVTPTEAYNG